MIGRWFRRLFRPRYGSMLYEVTPRCNLRCEHCYNVWKVKEAGVAADEELPTPVALRVVRKAAIESRCDLFTFTGGEPTLREDLEDLVREAALHCRQINLITNGTLLDRDRIESLRRAGVSLFELTLHAADRDVHNRTAGGVDCFDRVTRAAAEIRAQGAHLALVFVATARNIQHWEEMLRLGIALGAQGFLLNRYNAGGPCADRPETLMPSLEQIRRALEIAQRYASQYGVGVSASVPIPPCLIDPTEFPRVGMGYCPLGTNQAYWTIDPLGNVRPCNHSSMVLGNILDQPFEEIRRSNKLSEFMNARPALCSACDRWSRCRGGCKAAAQVCYGSPEIAEPLLALNREKVNFPENPKKTG